MRVVRQAAGVVGCSAGEEPRTLRSCTLGLLGDSAHGKLAQTDLREDSIISDHVGYGLSRNMRTRAAAVVPRVPRPPRTHKRPPEVFAPTESRDIRLLLFGVPFAWRFAAARVYLLHGFRTVQGANCWDLRAIASPLDDGTGKSRHPKRWLSMFSLESLRMSLSARLSSPSYSWLVQLRQRIQDGRRC